jgi:cobalt/nickel transport system permease protein
MGGFLHGFEGVERHARAAEQTAETRGLLQTIDPRIKVAGLLALIIAATAALSLTTLVIIFAAAVLMALASRIPIARLAWQVWLGVLLFTGMIALPALFLVPGDAIAQLPLTGWIVSAQGLRSALFLLGRAETSATLAALLILTTPWPHVLKALSSLGVPDAIVAVLGMTYRYIFVLLQSARDLTEARRSRIMSVMDRAARRKLLVTTLAVLLSKSFATAQEVHAAMIARGYRGRVHLLHDFRSRVRDWMFLAGTVTVAAAVVGIGL